jgi:hypothetical protein
MINQLLNREFMLDQMKQARKYLALPADERRRGGDLPKEAVELRIGEEDKRIALKELEQSFAQEQTKPSGQSPRFGLAGGEAPLDDWSFFSLDPIISNLQTVLDYYFTDGPGKTKVKLDPPPPNDRRGPGGVNITGNASLKGFDPQAADGRRIFNKFSVTDPEWVSAGLAAGVRLLRGRHKFVTEAPVIPIKDNARMVVVGDWGSGIDRAQNIAKYMRDSIDEGLKENREVHVVHLGDVYYSGWQREYEKRFLPYWPVKPGEEDKISSWCLNGNHDMYSGGFGYYDFLLKDARFKKQLGASFFCMENKNWKIFGLDSSYEDGGLYEPQADWVKARLDKKKKTMLLTHHQPFSSYETPAKTMVDKLAPVVEAADGVKSWFWGHEHRFMLFDAWQKVEFGRLVGHGGVPVYMTHKPDDSYPAPGGYEDRRFIPKLLGLEHWAYFGFAVLDFADAKVEVQYIDEQGKPSYSNHDTIA